jgi:hypothetical protein
MLNMCISNIKRFAKFENKVLLGRWSINYCNKVRNMKIDLANEDHCGSCNQYSQYIIKIQKQKEHNINQNSIIDIETVKY